MMNRFFTLLLAASCLTAVGQVEMQLRYLSTESHAPRSTEMTFSNADGAIDFVPIEWGGASCGSCGSNSSTDFSEPYPFGFATNCGDIGWIFPVNGYLRFYLEAVPNLMSIHTSWTGCCRDTEIEIAILQGNDWQSIDTVQFLGQGCGWQHLALETSDLLPGCTQLDACNFDVNATADDGSCHFLCQYCKEGTVWDEFVQGCIVANPSDSNFDGCVQLNDLLDLLSAYGDCGAEESPWQCGDPLEYQGYDYETVQIGEQCWFAENLRSVAYNSGDPIIEAESPSFWQETEVGMTTTYGADPSSTCYSFSPTFDACVDPIQTLFEYGRLYNGFAIIDERGLCPTGWSIPNSYDYDTLVFFLDSETPSSILKSSVGWFDNGNGEDSVGFHWRPAGVRNHGSEHYYNDAGRVGVSWTSTNWGEDGLKAVQVEWANNVEVGWNYFFLGWGLPVRCIKDAE